jgi:hypothetical protein
MPVCNYKNRLVATTRFRVGLQNHAMCLQDGVNKILHNIIQSQRRR